SFFFSSRRRHTRFSRDWSSDVCSSDLEIIEGETDALLRQHRHGGDGFINTLDHDTFSDLHLQCVRRNGIGSKRTQYVIDECFLTELARTDIDTQAHAFPP